jgi:DNA repair exonuclease SbcCD ATPase subunit
MEHNFFVVGENRVLAFLLNNIKYILWFLIIIIAVLSGVIAFLHYTGIQNQEQFKLQIDQEKTRSNSLISKLKKSSQQDSEWEQQILSQSSKQKKMKKQQESLIDRQGKELSEIKSILDQREQVVQQFQLEKTSTQIQINNLQLKVRSLQQQLLSTKASLTESKNENENVQTKISELETVISKVEQQNKKIKQKASSPVTAVKNRKPLIIDDPTITVEKLKITAKGTRVSVSYNLTNKSKKLQRGRTGMHLSSKKNLENEIQFRRQTSIPYKIKRYRVISRKFTKVKPGTFIRILIWNEKKELIFDEAHPIKR